MSIIGNPATRLYEILKEAKKHCNEKGELEQSKREYVKDVWAEIFDIDSSDEEKVFLAIVEVIQQIEAIKNAVDKIESSAKNQLIKTITDLEREIMNMKLDDYSYKLKDAINEERLSSLSGIGFALDVRNQYCNIDEEIILEFREKIDKLIEEVINLQLDDELKKAIIDNLKQVDLMIEKYKLYGLEGIKSAIENGVGSIILNGSLSEEASKNSNVKEVLKQVLNLLGSINTSITFVKNIAPIALEATDRVKNLFLS